MVDDGGAAGASSILWEKRGAIRLMTFNRPEAMNALDPKTRQLFGEYLTQYAEDEEARVLIITGTGRAFCAGNDLKLRAKGVKRDFRMPSIAGPYPMQLWKPVIAAINGYCLGGGLEIALGCDVRIAADDARLGMPEVQRSLVPGSGGMSKLPRLVPLGEAMLMLLTGDWIDSQEAYRIGLVQRVVPREALLDEAFRIAERIAENGPLAAQNIKEAVYRGLDMPLTQAMANELLFQTRNAVSEDTKEGLRAFAEKRKPNYRGR